MKRLLVIIAVVIMVAGIYFGLTREGVNVVVNKSTSPAASGTGQYKNVDACTILKQEEAQSQLGPGAKKGDGSAGNGSSDDIGVSSCIYYTTSTSTSSYRSVTVLSRSAKTKAGAQSNKNQFKELKPPNVTDVPDLGDAAFWSPEYGQLNVLAGDNWYIFTNGSSKSAERKQADAVTLATRLLPSL
jgi:hypothetical protein